LKSSDELDTIIELDDGRDTSFQNSKTGNNSNAIQPIENKPHENINNQNLKINLTNFDINKI